MNSTNKTKTSLSKFEEFFSTIYKDDVFEILEKYPDERSLTVNYEDLEKFDPDLADLLITKPEEVIAASQKAIKNIDPLMKEDTQLNIRFENLTNNIPLSDLLSKYIGNFVSADGIVRKTDEIRPRIETAKFECRGCMRLLKWNSTLETILLILHYVANVVEDPLDCFKRSPNTLIHKTLECRNLWKTCLEEPSQNKCFWF